MTKRAPLLVAAAIVVGCGGGGAAASLAGPPIDQRLEPVSVPVVSGDWYRPLPNVTWQWQLAGTINTEHVAEVYDVDLFETPDAVVTSLHAGPAGHLLLLCRVGRARAAGRGGDPHVGRGQATGELA